MQRLGERVYVSLFLTAKRPILVARPRERNRVERLINRLKEFRRVATRYEKLAANYLTMLTLATIVLWF